ncbi:MAG: oxidoreductase [Acidimicrobiia bacterium]
MSDRWTAERIADQTGRRVVITGASSGIGAEAARVVAAKGAEVVLAVRNVSKGEAVAQRIADQFAGSRVTVRSLDLASLASVRAFAAEFAADYDRLDVLVNNAGVMVPPYAKTEDGFELQMGTNHFGHFALTGLLMPLLEATDGSRIVNVSSLAYRYGDIDFDDLHWEKREYQAWRAYGDSKLANLYFTFELVRRYRTRGGPLAVAAHPGYTATELQRYSRLYQLLNPLFGMKPAMGALPTLRAGFDPEVKPGEFYGPDRLGHWRGYPAPHQVSEKARDEDAAARLWEVSVGLTGVQY